MKRSILLVLTLVLLLVLAPLALAAGTADEVQPPQQASFLFDDLMYSVELNEQGEQVIFCEDESKTALPDGVSYDLASNTLTFNGANLETFHTLFQLGPDDYWLPTSDLKIVLEGQNIFTAYQDSEIDPNGTYHCISFGGGVNVTMTGSGSLTATTQASNDGNAILLCEGSSLTIQDQAVVTAQINGTYMGWEDENGNPIQTMTSAIGSDGSGVSLTVTGNAQLFAAGEKSLSICSGTVVISGDAAFTGDGSIEFWHSEESVSRNSMTIQDNADVNITAYSEGLVLMDATLNISGGSLDIDLTAPTTTTEKVDEAGNSYDEADVWTHGIYLHDGVVNLTDGNVNIHYGNGNGIELGNSDEPVTASFTQSGGSLKVTPNEGAKSTNAINADGRNAQNTLTFSGGSTNLTGQVGILANQGSQVSIASNADVHITAHNDAVYLNDSSLTMTGGTLDLDMDADETTDRSPIWDENGETDETYARVRTVALDRSTFSLQGGTVTLDYEDGAGISMNNWTDNTSGACSFTQSGGTLTVTATGETENVGLETYSEDGSAVSAVFRGGSATMKAMTGMAVRKDCRLEIAGTADVSLESYWQGINLNQSSMAISGGDLDIDVTAPVDYNTDYDADENPYYSDYAWTDGIICGGSTLTMSGGNVTIDFPNGNGIGLATEMDETGAVLGTSSMTQSGGTLTITSNDNSVDSYAISVNDAMSSNTPNTATFTGGTTVLQAVKGLSVNMNSEATISNNAKIQVKNVASPYNWWSLNSISGVLNIYGGSLTVEAHKAIALEIADQGSMNQTGGTVTLDASGSVIEPGNYIEAMGLFESSQGSMNISGGTLDVTSDYVGMYCSGSFSMLNGTVNTYGDARGMMVVDGSAVLRGGSLNATTNGEGADYPSVALLAASNDGASGSLTITGGTHSFLGSSKFNTYGLVSDGASVDFEGGVVHITGQNAVLWQGTDGYNTTDGVNRMTLADGLHAVSNVTGNELQFVYEVENVSANETEYTYHCYYFTEDSTLDGNDCTDVTISSEEGEIPVDYTGSMEITSGQAIVGAPVVIKYTVVTHGTISLDLPDELRLIQDSLSVNGEPVSDLEDIEISGSAIIRFSVKPLKTGRYTVTSTVSTPFETYTTSMPVTASGFQATAPSMTKVPTVDVTGHGTPGDIITLEIRGQKGGIATVTGTVSSIGTFDIPVTLPIADMTQEESFTIEVYFTSPYSRSSGQLGATLTVVYRPDCIVLNNFYITNIVHNNKNERVPVTFGVDYLNNRVTQSFYTYWPDEPVFSFTVELDIPQNWTVNSVFIRIKLLNNTFIDVPLQMDGSPSLWEGELELEDPSNPPVEFQVFWNAHPTEIVQELQINAGSHSFLPIMDPSGTIYSGTLDNPVPGATVTLYFGGNGKTADAANAYVFDMTNYGQVNPQVSDALGNYAWNVPEGWWQIVATYEQDGRTYTAKSEWLHVLPIQEGVGLNLNLPTVDPDEPDTPHKPSGGTSATTPSQPTQTFRDVSKSSYYYDAVTWAVENGVTDGTGSNTFSPDKACTRAEIVTFLWRAAGKPAAKSRVNPFTDVSKSAYYYDAVLWAVEAGITQGTSATTFSPDKTCSRAEAVTFLFRAASGKASSGTVPFTDVPANAYYKDAVLWAVAENVTQGTGSSTFSPDKTCSRAEIVTFLYRSPLSE